MKPKPVHPLFTAMWIRTLRKSDLHALIDEVKSGDAEAMSRAAAFVAAESLGLWHNRARANLCRHFKNHPPSTADRNRMVDAIVQRLLDGRFSEQFKDQLAMAIRFAPDRLATAAVAACDADREYIRRYGLWIQHILRTSSAIPPGQR